MDLPTYTNIWRIEKRLYKLYDLRLPMPLPMVQIGVFAGVFVPWIVLLRFVGIPFESPWHVLYIVPPGVLTWLATRPVIEGKRLTELLISQTRYLAEPRTWCRLTPIREPREVVVVARVWRRPQAPAPVAAPERAALKTRRKARKQQRRPVVEEAPVVPAFAPSPAVASAPQPLAEVAAQREAGGLATADDTRADGPPAPRPAKPWRRTTRDISHEEEAPRPADLEHPPATPQLELGATGKRAFASGVRRPGSPPEFWKAGPAPESGPPPGEHPSPQAPVPTSPPTTSPSQPTPAAAAPEPHADAPRATASVPEPGDRRVAGCRRTPPAHQAAAASRERVPTPQPVADETSGQAPVPPAVPAAPSGHATGSEPRTDTVPAPGTPGDRAAASETRPEAVPAPGEVADDPSAGDEHVGDTETRRDAVPAPDASDERAAGSEPRTGPAPASGESAGGLESQSGAVPAPSAPGASVPGDTSGEGAGGAEPRTAAAPWPGEHTAGVESRRDAVSASGAGGGPESQGEGASVPEQGDKRVAGRKRTPSPVPQQQGGDRSAAASDGSQAQGDAAHGEADPVPDRRGEPVRASAQEPAAGPPPTRPDIPQRAASTRPDIPQQAKATRPDIPMVPGAFGSGGTEPQRPEEEPTREEAPRLEPPRPWSEELSKPSREGAADAPAWPPVPQPRAEERPPAREAGPQPEAPAAGHPGRFPMSGPAPRPPAHEEPPPAPAREVRSGPASPVRPRPLPPPPPAPPSEPAITPPGPEHEVSSGGLRRLIQAVSGGHGEADAEYQQRLQQPFQGTRHIVVLGCTGGAGQTVTALMLGHTFAQHNGEPVVAIDVNPGPGALARRTRSETNETLTGLITRADQVNSLTAMRRYTSQAKSGLDVIAAGKNPLQALDDRDYALAIRTIDRFYSVTLLDAAAAVVARVLPYADQIVLVAPASADAPRAVAMTFEWLDGHGYEELRSRAVTVINGVSRRSMDDVEQAEAVARGRCRALVRIPWDDHLSMDRAPRNELKSLRAPTRRAYLALAGVVAGGFTVVPERYQELQQEQEATR
ncbi:TcpE family conjugal transfer membrane protein [Spirillospora sp. CA-255316]